MQAWSVPRQRPFPAIQYQWVADNSAAPSIAFSVARSMMWNKPMWLFYILIAVAVVRDFRYSIGAAAFTVILASVVLGLMLLFYFFYYLAAAKAMAAPGSVWAAGFGPTELSLISPIATSVIDYAAITSVRRKGPIVILRYRGGVLYDGIPSQLVPEREFEMLRHAAKK